MKINLKTFVDNFVIFIIIIKFIFIFFIINDFIFKHYKKNSPSSIDLEKFFSYWRERLSFIFKISVAILFMIIFNPSHTHIIITPAISFLFYVFGLILIITANWNIFMEEPKWFNEISTLLS
jgi:hypothetical protein